MMTSLLTVLASCWVLGGAMVISEYSKVALKDRRFGKGLLFESPAVSVVGCAALCTRWPSCVTLTFQRRNCRGHDFLMTPSAPFASDVGALTFARSGQELVSGCEQSDAPPSNGSVVTWSLTPASLRGEVTCYDGFFTTTDVIVECTEGGNWQTHGRCLQHLWTGPPWPYYPETLPVPVSDGWSVCMEGYPTGLDRFSLDLMVGDDVSLRVVVRLEVDNYDNVLVLHSKLNGVWTPRNITYDCPDPDVYVFGLGIPFHMRVTATGRGTYEVYLVSVLCATYAEHPDLPASDVTSVNVKNDVNVTSLDVMCAV